MKKGKQIIWYYVVYLNPRWLHKGFGKSYLSFHTVQNNASDYWESQRKGPQYKNKIGNKIGIQKFRSYTCTLIRVKLPFTFEFSNWSKKFHSILDFSLDLLYFHRIKVSFLFRRRSFMLRPNKIFLPGVLIRILYAFYGGHYPWKDLYNDT